MVQLHRLICAFGILAALAFSGCAGPAGNVYERDGKTYGVTSGTFRDRWWNYYERGSSYLEGGYYRDAVDDFLKAVEQRDSDGRRARTYGMHFVDYFPHRELGIAYLGMGLPDEALRELEKSLSQAETAKAKFYINKARGSLLNKQGATSVPRLALAGPRELLTNAFQMDVSGKAFSDAYISAVEINGRPVLMELAEKEASFKRAVQLHEGPNEIHVKARDLIGNTAEDSLLVNVDRQGPVVEVGSVGASDDGSLVVSGTVYDISGITRLKINGRELRAGGEKEISFSENSPGTPGASVELSATDAAGNTTTALLGPDAEPSGALGYNSGPSFDGVYYASLDGAVLAASGKTAAAPPSISLKDLSDSQEVYFDVLYIEGSVSGSAPITSFTVNGEPVISRKGRKVFFNYLLPLKEGDNTVTLKAADSGNRVSERKVLVRRMPQKARSLGTRLTVSVLPFRAEGQAGMGGLSYDAFVSSLVEQKRFNLVERTMLEEVLREQNISQMDITDPSTAARLGKLMSAEEVLSGSVHETKTSIEVFARMVDTETAEITDAQDVYGEDMSLKGVTKLMEGLAVKLGNSYPLLEGLVIKRDGNDLLVDLGSRQGIKKNEYLLLFQEGEHVFHPVTGKDLGAPTELLGRAKVNEVYEDMSKAELVRAEAGHAINPMDKVITK